MGSRHFIDVFADGKWQDGETLVFKRNRNTFPDSDNREINLVSKVLAKEYPRRDKWFRDRGISEPLARSTGMSIAAIGRFKAYPYYNIENITSIIRGIVPDPPDLSEIASLIVDMASFKNDGKTETVSQWEQDKQYLLMLLYRAILKYEYIGLEPFITDASMGIVRSAASTDKVFVKDADEVRGMVKDLFSARYRVFADSRHPIKKNRHVLDLMLAIQRILTYKRAFSPNKRRQYLNERFGSYEEIWGHQAKEHPGVWAPTVKLKACMDLNLAEMEVRDRIMSAVGVVPRRADRLVTDGKIFERAIPEHGASLLVDASGSMAITNEQIEEIVRIAPASVIAMYFGGQARLPNGTDHSGGFLIIIADGGMTCNKIEKFRWGGNNSCDGIGLRWLGMQPEPRFWLSDGHITTGGNSNEAKGFADAAWCLKTYNINWVNTHSPSELKDIIKMFLEQDGDVWSYGQADAIPAEAEKEEELVAL